MDDLEAIGCIDSLDSAKGKRTFRRGRITRLKARFDELQAVPFRNLQLKDLGNLKGDFRREVKIHNALQTRYEELLEQRSATSEEMADEMTSSEDIKDQYRQYVRDVDSLHERYMAYQEIVAVESEIETIMELNQVTKIFENSSNKLISRQSDFLKETLPYVEDEQLIPVRKTAKEHLTHLNKAVSEAQGKKDDLPSDKAASTVTVQEEIQVRH